MKNPFKGMSKEEIRATWQSRALAGAQQFDHKLGKVLLVVLADEYAGIIAPLLHATFNGFTDITRPFLSGYATITQTGAMLCDLVRTDGSVRKEKIYDSDDDFISDMRNLADKLKLDDADRIDFFRVLRRWVTADLRVGVNGEKLAS